MDGTIIWQRIEGVVIFAAGIALFSASGSDLPWWATLVLFFAPDLSFLAYALGPRTGAFIYNTVHVYAFGVALLALGVMLSLPMLAALGALWLAHSGLDRMFGYGLKSDQGFGFTHLGRIGKAD